jgi:hypothetical protein
MTELTTRQAALIRGVRRVTILSWITRRTPPLAARKHGRDWVILAADLAAYKPAPKGWPKRKTTEREA